MESGGPRKSTTGPGARAPLEDEDVPKPSVKAMLKPKPLQIFETSWLPLQQFLACGL